MKSRQYRALFGLLSLVVILGIAQAVPSSFSVSLPSIIQRHCTASNVCSDICGDHICAPGELAQIRAQVAQAKLNSTVSSTTPTPAVGQSTTNIVGGKISYTAKASDGTIVVIRTGIPLNGQVLPLGIAFKDANGNFVQHQNYAVIIIQDNYTVLSIPKGHTHTGIDTQTIPILTSNDPLFIHVTLNGVGLPTANPSTWTGVKGEMINFSQTPDILTAPTPTSPISNMVNTTSAPTLPIANMTNITSAPTVPSGNATVPEFGPVVSLVLVIAITSIIAVSVKTAIIPHT